MTWTIDGCISMQNLDIVRGGNRIAMLDCENEALCDGDILANAKLIAAAPDMLELLVEAQEALDVLADDAADAGYYARADGAAELAMRLRTAIAKAIGAA